MVTATPLARPRRSMRATAPSQISSSGFPASVTGHFTEIRTFCFTGRTFFIGTKKPPLLTSTVRARMACLFPFLSAQESCAENFSGNLIPILRSLPMTAFSSFHPRVRGNAQSRPPAHDAHIITEACSPKQGFLKGKWIIETSVCTQGLLGMEKS